MNPKAAKLGVLYDRHGEKLRYLVVGVWNTAVSYVVFLIALKLAGPSLQQLDGQQGLMGLIGHYYYLVVQWAVWVFMVVHSTLTMKYIAFRSRGRLLHQIGRAYMVYLPAQGIASAVLWFTVKVLGLPPSVGQLVTIVFATVFSYLGHKYFTFRTPLEVGEVVPRELIEGASGRREGGAKRDRLL